jgi:hypothetical protein
LATHHEAHWAEPDPADPNAAFPLVCLHTPLGPLTWHVHPGDVALFPPLPTRPSDYDGHTTEEKYARLAALGAAFGQRAGTAEVAIGLFVGYLTRGATVTQARRWAVADVAARYTIPGTSQSRQERHTCPATGCTTRVRPAVLMCRRHWALVPPGLRAAVGRHYRPGQEIDKRPSAAYLAAARAAVVAVAGREAR